MAFGAKSKAIVIPAPKFDYLQLHLNGLSALLCNRWGHKAIKQMEDKHAQVAKTGKKEKRNPEAEFLDSVDHEGTGKRIKYFFPTAAFRLAAISAVRHIDGLTLVQARSLFWIPEEKAQILTPEDPIMDCRPVRNATGVADLRYRALFPEWSVKLNIRFLSESTTGEQIGNLFALAGEAIGVGELRVERGGSFGRFTIG